MYSREQNYRENIPDNYNGITMGANNDRRRDECRFIPEKEDACVKNDCPPKHEDCQKEIAHHREDCKRDECFPPCEDKCERKDDGRSGGILSSLLCRLGFDGVDNMDFIILFVALLLMSSDKRDEDSYIWLLLLFLLIK